MKDGKQLKIGCSGNPDDRLKDIKAQEGRKQTILIEQVWAKEMNGAETAAQNAVMELGFVKIEPTPTDWFKRSTNINDTLKEIKKKVKNAVYQHNSENQENKGESDCVYVEIEGNVVNIGFSKDKDGKPFTVKAHEMTGARKAAHKAVMKLGLVNITGNQFKISKEIDAELMKAVKKKVKEAVDSHNKTN